MCRRNPVPSTTRRTSSPARATVARGTVRTGWVDVHPSARKLEKSWVPTIATTAASIAAASSGRRIIHACPRRRGLRAARSHQV